MNSYLIRALGRLRQDDGHKHSLQKARCCGHGGVGVWLFRDFQGRFSSVSFFSLELFQGLGRGQRRVTLGGGGWTSEGPGRRGGESAVAQGPLSSYLGPSLSLPASPALPGCIDLLESF